MPETPPDAFACLCQRHRTCRSLLAELGVPEHVAERRLNHKLKGVERIYNRHDYFDERRDALACLPKS